MPRSSISVCKIEWRHTRTQNTSRTHTVTPDCLLIIDEKINIVFWFACFQNFILLQFVFGLIWLYWNTMFMVKIFRRHGGGGDTFKSPSPYEQLLPLSTPVLRCFWKDPLMTPTPTSSILHCYPLPHPPPLPPIKIFNHTLSVVQIVDKFDDMSSWACHKKFCLSSIGYLDTLLKM